MLATSIITARAAELPGYEEFRQVDRARRLTGQLQTAELLAVTQISGRLIVDTAAAHPDDWELQWGAAELLSDWTLCRQYFQQAVTLSVTNQSVLLRFAGAATRARDDALALELLALARETDKDSLVPWVLEVWLRHEQRQQPDAHVSGNLARQPASWASRFGDEIPAAARARIRLLERAGYSPYAARRLGFMPAAHATISARELSQLKIADSAKPVLLKTGRAMQQSPTFILTELVGQTLEIAAMSAGGDADRTRPEVRSHSAELGRRRDRIRHLLTTTEQKALDIAREQDMVAYFDNLLEHGEEQAMRGLLETVAGIRVP